MNTNLIVAYDKNRVIGINDGDGYKIPWHISEDMQYFKRLTIENIVVMGRKTFESIRKPLPNRFNIVVSKSTDYSGENLSSVKNIKDIYAISHNIDPYDEKDVFIIGGAQIYQEAIDKLEIDNFYITIINEEFNGNVFFPNVDWLSDYKFISAKEYSCNHPKKDNCILKYGRYHFTNW